MGGIVEAHAISKEYLTEITAQEGVIKQITLAEEIGRASCRERV